MVLLILVIVFLTACDSKKEQSTTVKHVIVAIEKDMFHGWPANNGVWIWDNEIVVGYTQVEYAETGGHNIKEGASQLSLLARSTDGGFNWKMYDPDHYVGDGNVKTRLTEAINFDQPGFALRVFGIGYHGTNDPEAGFYYSTDRAATWNGPYDLGDIAALPEFEGKELTPRTDYIMLSERECLGFISARVPDTGMTDKIACIRTRDGGLSFEFLSWMVPLDDPYRAVMPQSVLVSKDHIVAVVRRRVVDDGSQCWIDAYHSLDGGTTWDFLSKVADTGAHNGNPPAMTRLSDGRLCCIYGNRTNRQILAKYSRDNGKTWGDEFLIRDNFYTGEDGQDMKDLGYCRLVQTKDQNLVAIYYWASKDNPQQHIAASIWKP